VSHLLKLVKRFLANENPQTFCEKVNGFFYCEPRQGEDVFTFYGRLKEKIADIERLDHVARQFGASIQIPSFLVTNKILNAATRCGQYRPFIEKLQLSEMKEWFSMTPENFIRELQKVHTSTSQLAASSSPTAFQGRSRSKGQGGPRGRSASKGKPAGCPDGVCWDFFLKGSCPRPRGECKFLHPPQAGAKTPGAAPKVGAGGENKSNFPPSCHLPWKPNCLQWSCLLPWKRTPHAQDGKQK